ncbi:unnamed protein product, partial [Brassica rapa]
KCNGGGNLRRKPRNDGTVGLRLFLVPPVVSFILLALCPWLDSALCFALGYRLEAVGNCCIQGLRAPFSQCSWQPAGLLI